MANKLKTGKLMLSAIVASCILSMSAPTVSTAFPVCANLGPASSFAKLAAYYGPVDNRKLMSQGKKEVGISDLEATHLRNVTGAIFCLDTNGKYSVVSATLEGNGDRILTAAHALDQNDAHSIVFDHCYFQNEGSPQKQSPLALNSRKLPDAKFSSGWPQDSTADYASIRLEKSLHIKNPFPFDPSGRRLNPEDKIVLISGAQKGFDNHQYSEPIIQQCSALNVEVNSTTQYFTNCAMFHQGSGSVGYYRDSGGILNQKVIGTGSGKSQNVSENYDYSQNKYSLVQGLDRNFLTDADRLGLVLKTKQAQR